MSTVVFLFIRKFTRKVWEQETRKGKRSPKNFGCWKSIATGGRERKMPLVSNLSVLAFALAID